MDFALLGPLVVQRGQTVVPIPTGKQRVLLAALLLAANQVLTIDYLIDTMWDGRPPAAARVTLQGHVKRLRRTLGDHTGSLVTTRPAGYSITTAGHELDVSRFDVLLAEGQQHARQERWQSVADTMRTALRLWRGQPLQDVPSQTLAQAMLPRLTEMRLRALGWRVEADLWLGRHEQLVAELAELTHEYPLRERFHGQLMTALYRSGRQADALAAYQRLRQSLADELGVDPDPQSQQLYQQILTSDPALQPRAPITARNPVPAQLPSGVSPFVGRADQFADLTRHLLGSARPATPLALITGTGGCGKTALAVHWARQAAPQFPDGQLYLDLQGYSHLRPLTPLAALGSLLRALGVPADQVPDALHEATGLFRSRTADRRLLLVLDNARTAEQVRPLIPGNPGCAVLVTSRDRLDGLVARNSAHRVPVDVLSTPDATALLAQLLGPAHDPADLRRLTRACAQLPLALRIAAAHLDGASPAQLARYADLLETDAWSHTLRIVGDEHSSVRAAFELSYEALDTPEQQLFRLLGLVPGPDFGAAAAAALADITTQEAQQRLDRLATAHLITRAADEHYTLHDLLQAYAADLARAAGPVTGPQRGLATWYLATVRAATRTAYPEALRPPDEPTTGAPGSGATQNWLDREHHNILAVIDNAATSGDHDVAWRLTFAYRPHLFARSLAHSLHDTGAMALSAAEADADPLGQAAARLTLALGAEKLGALAEAAEHLRQAEILCGKTGWAAGQVVARNGLGVVWIQDGRPREAATAFEHNIAATREAGDREGEAHARMNLGMLIAMTGRLRDGVEQMRNAAAYYRESGPRTKLPPLLAFLGVTHRELGEFTRAERTLTEAITIGAETGDPYYTCLAEATLAGVHCDLGDFAQAQEHLTRAEALVERTGLAKLAALTALHRGWFELAQQHTDKARPWYERLLSYGESAGDPWHTARGLIGLAACLRADNQATASIRAAARALHAMKRCDYRVQIAQAHLELAQTHARYGSPHRAMAHARQAAQTAKDCGHWATTHTAAHVIAQLETQTDGHAARDGRRRLHSA